MALELYEQELPPGADGEPLTVALRQLTLMETYLQRFLKLGRETAVPHVPLALDEVVTDVLPLLAPACRHAGITLDWQPPPAPCRILGDAAALQQLLLNVLLNAIEAATPVAGPAGIVRVEVESRPDAAVLRVLDTGPGPSPAMQSRLFEPFATDKVDGTGLGLAVARQTATDHGATLTWDRRDGWTCFELRIPAGMASSPHAVLETRGGTGESVDSRTTRSAAAGEEAPAPRAVDSAHASPPAARS